MEKTLLKKYVSIRAKREAIEKEENAIREEILLEMQKNKLEKVESSFGNFTVGSRKTWSYSPKVTNLEEKVKVAKFKEQERGIAKASETNYLLFKGIKE